jgi:hypothetical protein
VVEYSLSIYQAPAPRGEKSPLPQVRLLEVDIGTFQSQRSLDMDELNWEPVSRWQSYLSYLFWGERKDTHF